jgi:peptide/nickel transport system ATP-binding protein
MAGTMSVIHTGRILEEGQVADVYANPNHAYTRALLAATPRFDRPGHTLQPVDDAMIARLQAEAAALDRVKEGAAP